MDQPEYCPTLAYVVQAEMKFSGLETRNLFDDARNNDPGSLLDHGSCRIGASSRRLAPAMTSRLGLSDRW
jgi:hypothetical protein